MAATLVSPAFPLTFPWLLRRHIPPVLDIEQTLPVPAWNEKDFLSALRSQGRIGKIALRGEEQVAGYMMYELKRPSLELLRLAVHPGYRHCGVGAATVRHLMKKLTPHRRTRLKAVVPESCLDVLYLLRSMDLRAERLLRGHFNDQDGILMYYRLPEDDGGDEAEEATSDEVINEES